MDTRKAMDTVSEGTASRLDEKGWKSAAAGAALAAGLLGGGAAAAPAQTHGGSPYRTQLSGPALEKVGRDWEAAEAQRQTAARRLIGALVKTQGGDPTASFSSDLRAAWARAGDFTKVVSLFSKKGIVDKVLSIDIRDYDNESNPTSLLVFAQVHFSQHFSGAADLAVSVRLVKQGGQWKVDDVLYPEEPTVKIDGQDAQLSLREKLKIAAARLTGGAPAAQRAAHGPDQVILRQLQLEKGGRIDGQLSASLRAAFAALPKDKPGWGRSIFSGDTSIPDRVVQVGPPRFDKDAQPTKASLKATLHFTNEEMAAPSFERAVETILTKEDGQWKIDNVHFLDEESRTMAGVTYGTWLKRRLDQARS